MRCPVSSHEYTAVRGMKQRTGLRRAWRLQRREMYGGVLFSDEYTSVQRRLFVFFVFDMNDYALTTTSAVGRN